MFTKAQADTSGRWAAFHFTSHDNPHISTTALQEITQDMSSLSYRQEILAEDVEEVPGAMWTRQLLEATRVNVLPDMARVVIGVDPPGGATECGIVAAGKNSDGHFYIIADGTLKASPQQWAERVFQLIDRNRGDCVVGEANYGGDMVQATIMAAAQGRAIRYKPVQATRGKAVRAEPVVALFEQGKAHIVGELAHLEEELCTWVPGESKQSPNRLDAMVWAMTELMGAPVHPEIVVFDSMPLVGAIDL
jgi:phage terminase large subunit-like protein